jgi:C4-type Zn-finger protein
VSDERPDENTESSGEKYPAQCPSCHQRTGKPKSVATVAGKRNVIRLEMLCAKCAHGWTEDKIDEKPEL